MKLYARRTSSSSQKVLWFLGELGLEYEFVATGGDAGGLDAKSYRELNPNGKVPTWVDQQGAVWESHAILRYLAAEYGSATWWPRTAYARSHIDRWMDWSQTKFDEAFMPLFWSYWRTPQELRNQQVIDGHLNECRSSIDILADLLRDQSYLAGETLTLADVPAGSLMYRYTNLDITDELPTSVARWYDRLTQRQSFQTHVMLPFKDLKGRLAY